MKLFLSWSGPTSQRVGAAIKDWLPNVLQSVHPYFTPSDLDKGSRWIIEISKELDEAKAGIICVTRDSIDSDWLLFEAGALSKTIEKTRVFPVLFGIKPTDLSGPLKQFQATRTERDDFRKLIGVVNECLGENKLPEKTVHNVFEKWWPDLERELQQIDTDVPPSDKPVRNDREILEEVLQLARRLDNKMRPNIVGRIPPTSPSHLLERYIRLHDHERNHVGGYQSTLDCLKELHGPVEHIVQKHCVMSDELKSLLSKFQKLSYKALDKETDILELDISDEADLEFLSDPNDDAI